MNSISNKGGGPAVLLVHGNSLSAETWEQQLNAPELAHLRLIAIDLPGCGNSAWYPLGQPYSLEGFAREVANFVSKLQDVVLVGHSLGGHVATRVPALVPNIRGLLLTGTPPLRGVLDLAGAFRPIPTLTKAFTAELTEDDAWGMARDCTWPDSVYTAMFARLFLAADPQVRAGIGAQVAADGLADEQAMIRRSGIPVCIAHGALDPLLPQEYLERLAPLFWRERVHVFHDAGHSPQLQCPTVFNALLLEFIRSIA